jgi:hypothetical protein
MKQIAKAIVMVALLTFIGFGLSLHWPKDAVALPALALVTVFFSDWD